MKKLVKIFSIVALLFVTLTLTGCSSVNENYDTKEVLVDNYKVSEADITVKEGYTFVGLYLQSEKTGTLYLTGSEAPKGTYEVLVVAESKVTDGVYSYPNMSADGLTFAGWYKTENFENGTRVATNSNISENVLYARYITLGDAALVSLVCIIIVFAMLALLWGIVSLFKYIAPKEEAKPAVAKTAPVVSAPQKALTVEDIKDEEMMAAALVATIDYHNETGENVRVVSIKQIG